ncbi:MAG: hypothetical protein ABIT71_22475 [Vicinamibacteraceae bacterium]
MRAEAVVALILGATVAVAHPGAQQPVAPAPRPALAAAAPAGVAEAPPTEVALGVGVPATAVFLGSFNAGQGQRYYLYGSTASFADLVTYYRGVLKDRGELVFDAPAVHMFDTGRFREEAMAFPPSVTVKDYTWGGKGGYLNPVRGAQPARYPTILQIVPATAGTP